MKKFSSRKLFKVLLAVVFFGLIVYLNPAGFFNPLRVAVEKVSYPFKRVSYSLSHKADAWGEYILSIGEMKEENARLLQGNQSLMSENSRLRDMERENKFLREQLEILPRKQFNLESAFIIGRDPQGLGNFIEIDKGSGHGLEEGMAVVVSKGVMIGKIEKVFSDKSLVNLVTNPKSAINIVISQSGAKGLVKGEYGLGIVADSILQTDSVSVGDEVVTSGMGNEIPKGLLIGTIQEIRPSSDHLFRQAIIASPIDFSALEIVFVVKGKNE